MKNPSRARSFVSYHPKKLYCARCRIYASDVEWRALLEEYLCWECRSVLQLENLKAAWRKGDVWQAPTGLHPPRFANPGARVRGEGDSRARPVVEEISEPLPSPEPYVQLDLFE